MDTICAGMDLEKKLDQYDRVFLFERDVIWFEAVFAGSDALKRCSKKIWIYSSSDVAYPEGISYGRICPDEEKELMNLYCLYEFSDRFHAISCNKSHGSLFHYVEQGLLSPAEMVEALLY